MQLDVTYQLRLRLYGSDNHGAVISNESNVINITVLANNHPFGLFSFPHANYSVTAGYVQWCIPFTYLLTYLQWRSQVFDNGGPDLPEAFHERRMREFDR